jgi:PPOX class probable F420-dependent enzyme
MKAMLSEAEASFVRWARVARLATVDAQGAPHVVPVCPVLDGDRVLFVSDANAKIRNLRAVVRCAVVFDEYVEDWDLLRQVQIRGTATVVEHGPEWERGKALLDEKYPQYEPVFPIRPGSLIVYVAIERVTSDGF